MNCAADTEAFPLPRGGRYRYVCLSDSKIMLQLGFNHLILRPIYYNEKDRDMLSLLIMGSNMIRYCNIIFS